ncbi:MAG: hypothetical protein H8E44_14630 [Planctomycetes bacterium]|nr:hypothetical protein [Planctomycetota bacterium]MBL7039912.1 hypothetical protein [Pirellulaceae bacterium]
MNQTIVTTPTRWFVRGFLVGILITASLTAISYFFRSDRGGNLVGTTPNNREALGFPVELWESGNTYGGYFVDYLALLIDAAFAAVVGAACGLFTLRHRVRLTRMVEELEQATARPVQRSLQFSMRGLLLATGLAALVAAGVRYALEGRAEVLGMIYLLGPWLLVLIAFLPLGLSWQQRVYILIPMALLLMAAAAVIGMSLRPKIEFDKVLLGIFICWTPQSVLAAIGLTAFLIFRRAASERSETEA